MTAPDALSTPDGNGDQPGDRIRLRAKTVLPVLALVMVLVVGFLPSPYVIEKPGPVFNTLGSSGPAGKQTPVVQISGRTTYPTTGVLDALTVSVVGLPDQEPSWLDLAAAWFDPSQSVTPVEEIYPPDVSEKQSDAQSAQEMTDSQQSATAAALTKLGVPLTSKLRVAEVEAGTAASGRLRTGDVITSVNGEKVVDTCSLQDAVVANGSAHPAAIVVTRAGRSQTISVTPRSTTQDGVTRPVIGVFAGGSYSFPFTVALHLSDVGGPSAGMMFALGIIDKLTPGSLTGGHHVAGTGTICADGTVGAIGGIVQKMYAARGNGATAFLAPQSNCADVRGHIPSGLRVFAVRTLTDSLTDLKVIAAGENTSRLASCSGG